MTREDLRLLIKSAERQEKVLRKKAEHQREMLNPFRPFTWRRKEEAEWALYHCQSVLTHLYFYEEHWDNLPQEYQCTRGDHAMENSKSKPDYFKVVYSIRTPSYYRPETTDSIF